MLYIISNYDHLSSHLIDIILVFDVLFCHREYTSQMQYRIYSRAYLLKGLTNTEGPSMKFCNTMLFDCS